MLSATYALTISDRGQGSLNADVSENRLPETKNNFSDYDISQSHDWECPSLSPHVLLDWTTFLLKTVLALTN